MIRGALVLVLVLLGPSLAAAQESDLLVQTPAQVHKAPSVASAVVGRTAAGSTLAVTRDVGDWVKVSWTGSPDGVGYVRKSAGRLVARAEAPTTPVVPASDPGPALQSPPSDARTMSPSAWRMDDVDRTLTRLTAARSAPAGFVAPPTHLFGLGAQVGGAALGMGVSARAWSRGSWGLQVDIARYALTDTAFATRMTSTQIGPRVLYAFRDRVSDYMWLRPYAGAGAHFYRSTLSDTSTLGMSSSNGRFGTSVLGGAELTFPSAPRVGLSTEVGYLWFESPFAGYALDGVAVSVSGHWYLR